MFNKQDKRRDEWMLNGSFAKKGYDWWWHSFTAVNEKTGKERGIKPSYLMVKAGWWGKNAAQLHKFIAWDDVRISGKVPYSVFSGDFYASC